MSRPKRRYSDLPADAQTNPFSLRRVMTLVGVALATAFGIRAISKSDTTNDTGDSHLRHQDINVSFDTLHSTPGYFPTESSILNPDKFIHEGAIRPPFVQFMTKTPTTDLFNITNAFGAGVTSLEAASRIDERRMTSAQKIAKSIMQQWEKDVILNGKGTIHEGFEDARQVSDLKTVAVENGDAMRELIAKGMNPTEAMREIFREKVLVPLVVNHCLGMIKETGLYKVREINYLTNGDFEGFKAQITQLKSDPQFDKDMREVAQSLNPEIMKEFANLIAEFDWEKTLQERVPSSGMSAVATSNLGNPGARGSEGISPESRGGGR